MAFTTDEIRANRDYFAHKLRAEKQRTMYSTPSRRENSISSFWICVVESLSPADASPAHFVPRWTSWSYSYRFFPKAGR